MLLAASQCLKLFVVAVALIPCHSNGTQFHGPKCLSSWTLRVVSARTAGSRNPILIKDLGKQYDLSHLVQLFVFCRETFEKFGHESIVTVVHDPLTSAGSVSLRAVRSTSQDQADEPIAKACTGYAHTYTEASEQGTHVLYSGRAHTRGKKKVPVFFRLFPKCPKLTVR